MQTRAPDPLLPIGLATAIGSSAAIFGAPAWFGLTLLLFTLKARLTLRSGAIAYFFAVCTTLLAHDTLQQAATLHASQVDHFRGLQVCEASGTLLTSPSARFRDGQWTASALVKAPSLHCGIDVDRGAAVIRLDGAGLESGRRGQSVHFVARLSPPELFAAPGSRAAMVQLGQQGYSLVGSTVSLALLPLAPLHSSPSALLWNWVDAARNSARLRLVRCFGEDDARIARALVLGESDLTAEQSRWFRASGTAHLLAVSGSHLLLVAFAARTAFRTLHQRVGVMLRYAASPVASAAIGTAVCWLYADFAGRNGSVVRAAFMISLSLFAQALRHRMRWSRCVGLGLVLACVDNALWPLDVSFQLSMLASLAMLWVGRLCASSASTDRTRAPSPYTHDPSGTWRTTAIMFATAPTLATLGAAVGASVGASLGPAPLLANPLAAPVAEIVALPIALLCAALGDLPLLGALLTTVGTGSLRILEAVASATALIPSVKLLMPGEWGIACAALPICLVPFLSSRLAGILVTIAASLIALTLETLVYHRPRAPLEVTMLDVGQGDATLLRLPKGAYWLVDAGGSDRPDFGERTLLPTLQNEGVYALDVVIISHAHPDHFRGLAALSTLVPIRELWLPRGEHEENAGLRATLRELQRRGTRVRGSESLCHLWIHREGIDWRIHHPCPSTDDRARENDNSFVLSVRYGNEHLLFVGDAEERAELQVVESLAALPPVTLLKVGHHGSRSSSSHGFLAATRPQLAWISAGARNPYGHPHKSTLERMLSSGIPVMTTPQWGSLRLQSDGQALPGRRHLTTSFAALPARDSYQPAFN